MGVYLIPDAKNLDEAMAFSPLPLGGSVSLEEGGVLVTVPDLTDDEVEALYAGFVPQSTGYHDWPLLPADLRGIHASHIRQLAGATQAQLDALTVAEARHMMRDLAKAMVLLVDHRLGE